MYFPIGWPKAINLSFSSDNVIINHVCCDAVKILVAAISNDVLSIWYLNPLMPISFHQRSKTSVDTFGFNKYIVWKPDSREIAVLTELGVIVLYKVNLIPNGTNILQQVDPLKLNRKRESSELFLKENIPRLNLLEYCVYKQSAPITVISCISLTELLIATTDSKLIRLLWSDLEPININNNDANSPTVISIDLKAIPFYVKQVSSIKSQSNVGDNAYVATLEYSPFIGGCAAVFNDKRAAVLIAAHLQFESQSMHGFWLPDVDDATACSVNHKFRLMAYGRQNSDVIVYAIDDSTGGVEYSHVLSMDSCSVPQNLDAVSDLRWSPDGCVLAVTWNYCGIALWSTFGTLLMSSFNWDFGLHADILVKNPLTISKLEWSTEGYKLFLTCKANKANNIANVFQLNFIKSVLTTNPCMTSQPHILLQGDDTLYLNQGGSLERIYSGLSVVFPNAGVSSTNLYEASTSEKFELEAKKSVSTFNVLSECKHWVLLQLPLTYSATNWPIRYSAVDMSGHNLVVAGRTGIAHCSMMNRKWKVFGNETQEKDFVVSGGITYWNDFIILGCYSLLDRTDEIRCYPVKKKLDNEFGNKMHVRAPVISFNRFRDQLIILTADGIVSLFLLIQRDESALNIECVYEFDVKNICVHPACIVSLTVTHLRNDTATVRYPTTEHDEYLSEAIIVNVSGRILMIQRDLRNNIISSMMASCLASCVECFWTSMDILKSPMHESLWLYSGVNGMRVWLPILPPNKQVQNASQHLHTFMSKRIMLSFPLKLYPLVILFDNAIALGVENETTLYCNEIYSHFSLPFCVIENKSQVYLHKILRQLIKRNLGYSAWEIAKSCRSLPYFSHSLELLLHEVLEDEATSKEPIPDALLPSILNFIREFPLYLKTVVQCARKTEIALWPYLFSVAGKPKDLFQQCLQLEQLDTAAGFLVILQNLEPSFISKQYAALLLDISIKNFKWELSKDLIRFLKAIDPNEIDSPRSSMNVNVKIAPHVQAKSQVLSNAEAFDMILGPIARERSFSTANILHVPKERKEKPTTAVASKAPSVATSSNTTNEVVLSIPPGANSASIKAMSRDKSIATKDRKGILCIDMILQQHARSLLQNFKLLQLGYMNAFLDFHLVSWLSHEAGLAARLNDFVVALKCLHKELNLSGSLFPDDSDEYGPLINTNYSKPTENICLDDVSFDRRLTKSITSESGYFSLARLDTPVSFKNPWEKEQNKIFPVEEDESKLKSKNYYHAKDKSFPYAYNDTSDVSSKGLQDTEDSCLCNSHKSCYQDDKKTFTKIQSKHFRILPEKLAIKLRYLLQLFIEANCIEYALVLSILLKDGGSIGRIINGIVRSESTAIGCRVENGLNRLLQWSINEDCMYRTFMVSLRPHICLLEQYLSSQNSFGGNSSLNRTISTQISEEANENQNQNFAYIDQRCLPDDVDTEWAFDINECKKQNQLSQQCLTAQDKLALASNTKDTLPKGKNTCGIM